jgi:inosine-uridine nucleoside N-ribohydrolase
MRFTFLMLAALLLAVVAPVHAQPQAGPVSLIFDTDMGNDVDDAMALAMIHALQTRRECRLLAVTVTKDNPYASRFVDLMNTFYGRGEIPIGVVRQGMAREDGKYLRQVVTATDGGKPRYPHDLDPNAAPEAVGLLRSVLAAQPDGSVVMVQVGFSTNLTRLLDSPADSAVPVPGRELVRRKVRLLSIMAGAFGEKMRGRKEYNVIVDLPAAKKLFTEWPTPIVASGWEIGAAIKHPAQSMREDYAYVTHHPLREAYHYYRGLDKDQPTYDLTSVLYAVRPDRGYFDLSPRGRIVVEANGTTSFVPDPSGPHRYLIARPEQVILVREAQVMLCSQPGK